MIVRALEEDHYTVSKATSGPEALRMIDEHMPDLVVLDYKMTGMDGLAVMKTLRTKPETQPLPVLMLTAMTDEPSTCAGLDQWWKAAAARCMTCWPARWSSPTSPSS
jgi:two-component system, OmpR family, phosphate regulon response regulator PhoB